jgi:hypothetical protein
LSKFNEGQLLPRSLIDKIEDFFEFYWDNNPLQPFVEEYSGLYGQLNDEIIHKIYIEYLFSDFLYTFKNTFVIIEKKLGAQSVKYNDFIFEILNNLMPRLYHESDDFIQDQYHEIFEVLFIT